MKVVDICCGIGGFSLGFKMIKGIKIKAGIDINKKALNVFQRNFSQAKIIHANIMELNVDDIPDADIYIAGIPCQPFSIASKNPSWDAKILGKFFEIVILKKAMFALENVIPLGYVLGHGIFLNAFDFGVPQKRKRWFLMNFPLLPYKKKNLPLAYFFPDVKEMKYKKSYAFRLMKRISRFWEPAFTITKEDIGHRNLIFILKNGEKREITIDDYKILFGFPKHFQINGDEIKMIGESVCPPIAMHIAKSSLFYLPLFYKIMGKKRWKKLTLRSEERLCVQLNLIP